MSDVVLNRASFVFGDVLIGLQFSRFLQHGPSTFIKAEVFVFAIYILAKTNISMFVLELGPSGTAFFRKGMAAIQTTHRRPIGTYQCCVIDLYVYSL